jgi:hypothetical protein
MLEELARIALEARTDDPFFGEAEAVSLREWLAEGESLSPQDRLRMHQRLGFHELRLGNSPEAIRHYQAAADLLGVVGAQLPPAARNDILLQLAIANLRWGEDQNCVARHTAQSCIFPIRAEGVHLDQEGSRKAMEVLSSLLALDPDSASARWLLNLAAMTVGDYPDGVPELWRLPPEAVESQEDFPLFTEAAGEVGLAADNLAGGAVVDDFDGDGILDVLTSTWDPNGQLLFFHGKGKGRFEDRTEKAGLIGILGGLNLVQADYDGDGDLDAMILRGAWMRDRGRMPNSLLRASPSSAGRCGRASPSAEPTSAAATILASSGRPSSATPRW